MQGPVTPDSLIGMLLCFTVGLTAIIGTNATCVGSGKPFFFSVCAVFKNEAVNIHEWVSHYLLEGADHMFLVDNDSSDDFMPAIQQFIDQGQVTVMINQKRHAHLEILKNYILPILNATEWMLNVDLDEFIYARQGSTADVLRAVPCHVASVSVPWKIFGSAGHKQHPKGSLVKHFVQRSSSTVGAGHKALFRSAVTEGIHIHAADVTGDKLTLEVGEKCEGDDVCVQASREGVMPTPSFLQLNHYSIQSLQWFVNTKISRGDASSKDVDNVRNIDYFEKVDAESNEVEDIELYLKHKQFFDSL